MHHWDFTEHTTPYHRFRLANWANLAILHFKLNSETWTSLNGHSTKILNVQCFLWVHSKGRRKLAYIRKNTIKSSQFRVSDASGEMKATLVSEGSFDSSQLDSTVMRYYILLKVIYATAAHREKGFFNWGHLFKPFWLNYCSCHAWVIRRKSLRRCQTSTKEQLH